MMMKDPVKLNAEQLAKAGDTRKSALDEATRNLNLGLRCEVNGKVGLMETAFANAVAFENLAFSRPA